MLHLHLQQLPWALVLQLLAAQHLWRLLCRAQHRPRGPGMWLLRRSQPAPAVLQPLSPLHVQLEQLALRRGEGLAALTGSASHSLECWQLRRPLYHICMRQAGRVTAISAASLTRKNKDV